MRDNLLSLEGRVALVTGAGQGIGREVAHYFAAHGAQAIIVNDYDGARARKVAGELQELGTPAIEMCCDIADFDAVRASVETAAERFGRVDILVNNAGNAGPESDLSDLVPFWESDQRDMDRWTRTNLFGVMIGTRHVLPLMMKNGFGRIITVISDAGRVGEPNLAAYSAAKAGAAGFTRAVAKIGGRYGITANNVSLGTIATPGMASRLEKPGVVEKMVKQYVIRRLGEPADAAALILYLASDAASWITGQTYPVNGGYSVSL